VQKEMFKELLNLLNPDEAKAAVEYHNLHQRLTRFFDWNNGQDPMALADEVLDRLAKRAVEPDVKEGVRNTSAFALGIARHLLQEEVRRQIKMAEISRHWQAMESTRIQETESEPLDNALQHCLGKMQPERRSVVEAYYCFEGAEKIKVRQRLAEAEGLSLNALRNRALRARQDLEKCMRKRLGKNIP
jgi:DNA-directed RNA polymerase specialized sigma24 family protein